MKVIFLLLTLVYVSCAQVEPYGTEICRLFADGVQLRLPGSCQDYITCQDGKSQVTSCPKMYNKDTKKCVNSNSDDYCADPCEKKSPTFVTDPKSCEGYYKCKEGVGTPGTCSSNFHFYEKSQACVYPEDSPCKGYAYCDIVPNDIPFKDESSCNTYFKCIKGKLNSFFCDVGYYHTQKGCTKMSEVECAEHPVPVSLCGTNKKPIRNKFVIDQRTCRGYWYCTDKGDNTPDPNPIWGQCPKGYFFDFSQQACYTSSEVVCEEDRCDGLERAKVISGTPGCQHYLLCDGDVTVGEEECGSGMYFDDKNMVCTTEVRKYVSCS